MANKKITELTELLTAATDDVLAIVDVSGTAQTKKISVANLTGGGGILTQASLVVPNADVLDMKYDDQPLELVAATAGKIHVPVSVTILTIGAGSADSSNANLFMGWDAATSATSDYLQFLKRFMNGVSSGSRTGTFTPQTTSWVFAYPASAVNQPLELWSSDAFNGGWSMIVYTTYYSITV